MVSTSIHCALHSLQHTVDVALAVGLSVGLTWLLLFIVIPICVVVVGVCIVAKRRKRTIPRPHGGVTAPSAAGTTAAQTTPATAPATQPSIPELCSTEPQETPPPYFGGSYPAYPPPFPQVETPI